MPPKTKAAAPAAEDESPSKKTKAGSSGPVTAGAKAAANGAESIERSDTPRPPKEAGLVFAHWNIAGLNGLLKSEERKQRLLSLLKEEDPDVLALSEHKLSEATVTAGAQALMALCPSYTAHWAICTAKNGYSGIGVLVKRGLKVLSVKLDEVCNIKEGRTVTLELEEVFLVASYVPNSGQALQRLDFRIDTWDPALRAHLTQLQQTKPVCLIGDLNVAHLDADIWNVTAKHIPKSAGLTPRERESFGKMLEELELLDAFRSLHPDATGCFSFWSTRSGNQNLNRGLRLDYAVISKGMASGTAPLQLHFCDMLKEYAPNGDHCPTIVGLKRP